MKRSLGLCAITWSLGLAPAVANTGPQLPETLVFVVGTPTGERTFCSVTRQALDPQGALEAFLRDRNWAELGPAKPQGLSLGLRTEKLPQDFAGGAEEMEAETVPSPGGLLVIGLGLALVAHRRRGMTTNTLQISAP